MRSGFKQEGVRCNMRRYGSIIYNGTRRKKKYEPKLDREGNPQLHGFMWVNYGEGGHKAVRLAASLGLITWNEDYIYLKRGKGDRVTVSARKYPNLITHIRRMVLELKNKEYDERTRLKAD